MKKIIIITFAAVIGAAITYLAMQSRLSDAEVQAQLLKTAVENTQKELLGHTSYTSFITVGKQSLEGQMKLVTATIVRNESVTQLVERAVFPGISSSGAVKVSYSVEYSFGFDLRPNQYDVRAIPSGIEIRVKKPSLVATPAVSHLEYQVLSEGLLINTKAATLKLYAEAAERAKAQGRAMESEAPILALCEKKLIEFLHGFLSKQPGVKVVPHISVVY